MDRIIKDIVFRKLFESKSYDERLSVKSWYDEEVKKLDDIKDFKVWKIKSKLLQKQYLEKMGKLSKTDNPYGMEGDMDSNFLYHYTTGHALMHIIRENIMYGDYSGICFTTNPNLYKRGFVFWHSNEYSDGKNDKNVGIKIKFDFKQMLKDGFEFKKGSENIGTHAGEEEIRLRTEEFKNPIKYIKEIIILKNKEKNYEQVESFLKNYNLKFSII